MSRLEASLACQWCSIMRSRNFAILVTSLSVLGAPAMAAPTDPIGSAIQVVNLVTAEINRDTRTLQIGDSVHQNENIEVGTDAKGELKLDDDTKLALGPGSKLTLDKFVYDADKASGSIVMNFVKGTFRFVTGVAKKPTYRINTPTASITVRGTIFDLYVETGGTTWLLLHEGAVEVCNTRGRCRVHDEPGKLIPIGDKGDVGIPVKWAGLPGHDGVPFDTAFPFVVTPPAIDPDPIFTRAVIIDGNFPGDRPRKAEDGDEPRHKPSPTHDNGDDRPKKKVEKYKDEPKKEASEPKPAKDKVATERPKKKSKTAKNNDAEVAKGLGLAIGIGIAIGSKGGGHHGHHNDGPMRGGDGTPGKMDGGKRMGPN